MKILLYNISKDINSTASPSGEAVELTGNLRIPSSVENPVIEIEAETLPKYNYAYIPAFSRYYWINNWGCSTKRLYVLSLSVDPLATYAGDIGASTQYVLRAADEFDGTITDMLYPTKNAWKEYKTEYNSPFNLSIDDCYWCVGIKGSGATNFYLFKPNGIDAFFEYLLKPGAGGYTEDALGNLSLSLDSEAAVVVDPLQYISSVTCIPVNVGLSFVAGELITIGYVQDKFFYNCVKMDITSAQIATFSYTAPGHPDVARGTYLNNAPYANYYAYVPGFGKIDLDPSIVANNTITMTLRMDYRHGDCLLTISAGDAGIITRLTTSIGIPFEFSQVIAKGTGALTAANMAGSIVGGILSGNVEGVIGGATSAVKSAIENSIPSANSIGSNGSFAAISGAKVQFVARYARPVAEDNDHRGRPLCAKRKISSLSGYIMCADSHMHPAGATTSEINAIESAMNSGFYYESEAPAPSPAIIERLNVTANGTYSAPSGVDGYSPVVVNVPQGTSDHTQLTNRDASNQHPISAITGLQSALDGKQAIGDYATETYVNNHHDSTKQDVISDLDDIRSGAALGATAVQPEELPASEMFTAVYGSTSYEDVVTAYNSGKKIQCKRVASGSNYIFDLTLLTSGVARFGQLSNSQLYTCSLTNANVWSTANTAMTELARVGGNISTFTNDSGYLTLADLPIYEGSVV